MTMVATKRRHTRQHPCAICGGCDQDPRGQGRRCAGFTSEDGAYVHCSRVELSGGIVEEANGTYAHFMKAACRCGADHRTVAAQSTNGHRPQIVERYDYIDAGELKYQVVRTAPKGFRQRRPDGKGGWIWDLKGVTRIPYRLDELRAADPEETVFTPEGEKDTLKVAALGLVATTNSEGAKKWRDEHSEHLAGRRVVVLQDNDSDGRAHAHAAAQSLVKFAREVRILELPGLPEHGDVSDWIAAGGTAADLCILADLAAPFLSDAPKEEVSSETKSAPALRFRTAAEISREVPREVVWIARPWLAAGAITEMAGRVKLGKTTLFQDMIACIVEGRPFMGEATTQSPIVYLTEQQPTSFTEALKRAALTDCEDLHVLYWHEARGEEWPNIVDAAIAKAEATGARTVIVDTLSPFAGIRGDSENDAGAAQAALEPLQYAASRGLAILIGRHERKGGGEVGESGRGSSAYAGGVDIVLALKRPEGNTRPSVRVIHALSRFEETPDTLVIERTQNGYVAVGTAAAVAAASARTALLSAAPATEGDALSEKDLLETLPKDVSRTTARDVLSSLMAEGLYRRLGAGKRGNPFRYWSEKVSDGTQNIDSQKETISLPDAADHCRECGADVSRFTGGGVPCCEQHWAAAEHRERMATP